MKALGLILITGVIILCGCSGSGTEDTISIMSWNVQNLFDDVDNGTEYYEFDPGGGDWNYDSFSRKAAAVADVITAAVSGGPDIVLLQEVENANAVKHLNENFLKSSGYSHTLFFPTEGSAIGTAVLSRFRIESANSHAVICSGRLAGRNISDVSLLLPDSDDSLVILVNHWKSKLGGAEKTEEYRIAAARMLSGLMSLRLSEQQGCVLAAGDYNESHDEFNRIDGLYPTAMTSEGLAGADGLGLYNPWKDSEYRGSYYYNGSWETIDQFLLSEGFFDGYGWDYSGFRTVILEFNSTVEGRPLGWQSSTNIGASDHFPILLELKKTE